MVSLELAPARRRRLAMDLAVLEWRLTAFNAALAFDEFRRKYNYNPNQPRVPAGNPDGGQWTDAGGGGGGSGNADDGRVISDALPDGLIPGARYAQARGRGSRTLVGRWPGATPHQEVMRAISASEAEIALERVREIDPTWRPTPSIGEGIEGEIARNNSIATEARSRLATLRWSLPSPESLQSCLMPEGQPVGWRERGARPAVRTLAEADFSRLLERLTRDARNTPARADYRGLWYQRPDGTIVGIRMSEQHGLTIDVIDSGAANLLKGYKVHSK